MFKSLALIPKKISKLIMLIVVLQSVLCYVFYSEGNTFGLLLNLLLLWFCLTCYAFYQKQNGIIYFGFLITFFVFLLGTDLFAIIVDIGVDIDLLDKFSRDTRVEIYLLMTISLISIFWGFLISKPNIKSTNLKYSGAMLDALKNAVRKTFYYTLPFKFISTSINVYSVAKFGYANIDSDVSGGILLSKLVQVYTISFYSYIMLAPEKKELMPVLKWYVVLLVFSLFGGVRGEMMYPLLCVVLYCLSRDYLNLHNGINSDSQIFLTKKIKTWILIGAVPFLIFLNLFSSIRTKSDVNSQGLFMDLVGFFIQVGGSYNVIGITIENKDHLPKGNVSYSFGPIVNFFEYGTPSQLLGIGTTMPSRENIPYIGNNLGATVTNIDDPYKYINGSGYGTQYIAEQYADFGCLGVFVLSFLLGIVIAKFSFFNFDNYIISVLVSYCVPEILSMPRDFYSHWVVNIISPFNIFFLFLLIYICKNQQCALK